MSIQTCGAEARTANQNLMPAEDFFDFREKLPTGRVPRRVSQPTAPKPQALSVSQLTAMIDGALRKLLPSASMR